jgi:hypothetical protein
MTNRRTALLKPSNPAAIRRDRCSTTIQPTQTSLGLVLDNSPKLIAIFATFLGIAALAHEWGYYSVFGLELSQVPVTAADQFKNLLALIPNTLKNSTNVTVIALLFLSRGVDQSLYKKASWILGITGALTALGYSLLSKSSVFRLDGLDFVFLAILLRIFSSELADKNEVVRKKTALAISLIFIPVGLFAIGERSAAEFRHEAPIVYIFLKDTDTRETALKGSLLRSYEKQLLISTEKGEIIFQPLEKVVKIEVLQRKTSNFICRELPSICFLK